MHLIIYGRVQGVGFRYSARQTADALGLTGWVRNLPDRTVEVVAEGADTAIGNFLSWAQHGPPGAEVERVSVQEETPEEDGRNFRIER